MNQLEIALINFKANLKTSIVNKYLDENGKHDLLLSENIRKQYKKEHPKIQKINTIIKSGHKHPSRPLISSSIILNRIFSK